MRTKYCISNSRATTTLALVLFFVSALLNCASYALNNYSALEIALFTILPVVSIVLFVIFVRYFGKKNPALTIISMALSMAYLCASALYFRNQVNQSAIGKILSIVLYIVVFVIYVLGLVGTKKITRMVLQMTFALPLVYRVAIAAFVYIHDKDGGQEEFVFTFQKLVPYFGELFLLGAILCLMFSLRHVPRKHHRSNNTALMSKEDAEVVDSNDEDEFDSNEPTEDVSVEQDESDEEFTTKTE